MNVQVAPAMNMRNKNTLYSCMHVNIVINLDLVKHPTKMPANLTAERVYYTLLHHA